MNWAIWLAFGIGLFIGANLGVLLIGLLVASRDDREIKKSMDFERNVHIEFN